ncbi:MAG: hypothetical protein WDO56_03745 [Gammaproteobacteria bacterium]
MKAAAGLAVFDLDGTITRHDTLIQFVLGYLKSRPWRLFGFVLAIPAVLQYMLRFSDRGALKGAPHHWTLGGSTRRELEDWTAKFVPRLLETRRLPARDAADRRAQAQRRRARAHEREPRLLRARNRPSPRVQ